MKCLTDLPLALSSSFLPSASPDLLRECKACGISAIELSIGGHSPAMNNESIQAHWNKLIAGAGRTGLALWSAHLSFWDPYDLANLNVALRQKAVERQLAMLHFLRAETDIKVIVVHPSFEPVLPDDRWKQTEASKQSLRILADEAASFGAQIAVECLPRTCLGNSIDSMAQLLSCDSRLRVCFDTNHMLTDTNEAFVRAFGDKIITLHISDYDRIDERHRMPGEGINNWNAIFKSLLASGYSGPLLFELSDKYGYTLSQIEACYKKLCANFERIV